jgi:hypothetical protein
MPSWPLDLERKELSAAKHHSCAETFFAKEATQRLCTPAGVFWGSGVEPLVGMEPNRSFDPLNLIYKSRRRLRVEGAAECLEQIQLVEMAALPVFRQIQVVIRRSSRPFPMRLHTPDLLPPRSFSAMYKGIPNAA